VKEYAYRGRNSAGQPVSGVVEAASEREAKAELRRRGIRWESLEPRSRAGATPTAEPTRTEAILREIVAQGKSLVPPLEAVAKDIPVPSLQRRLRKTLRGLQRSQSFEDLLRCRETANLLPLVIHRVGAPDSVAPVGAWISDVVAQLETRRKQRFVIFYPILLALVCAVVFYFLAVFVVPIFSSMFEEFQLPLPPSTQLIIRMSDALRYNLLEVITVLVFSLATIGLLWYVALRRAWFDRLFGSLAAGRSSNLVAMQRMITSLAELLRLGIPLPDALYWSGRVAGNALYARAAARLASRASGPGSAVRLESKHLPRTLTTVLTMEAPLQSRIGLLREIGQIYQRRSRQRLGWLLALLPSLATILLGLFVGFVVIALFMPLVSLVSSLS
jgi:type IV pilus assembly protein PilC